MGWFKKKNPIVAPPPEPEVPENPVTLQKEAAVPEKAKNKKKKDKRKKKKKQKKAKGDLKLVVMGAKVQCSLCTCPIGTLTVINPMVPSTQGKLTATESDNTKLNIVFTGTCTKSPNAAVPCVALMQLGPWQNTGSFKMQDKAPLLQKSTVKCLYGGVDIQIKQCGQMNDPIAFDSPSPHPEEEAEEVADLSIGMFFDGTLNSKKNTEARWLAEQPIDDPKSLTDDEKEMIKAFKKSRKDKTSSYYNDYSNVARLWKYYDEPTAIYIEGIGTEDLEKDDTNGYAFGAGKTGVIGKVKKGCEKLAEKIKLLASVEIIEFLELDVFGFSRGATAARNFVYEVNKPACAGNGEELPEFGHLGLILKEKGIEVKKIRIRFLGIFDSVSSHHEGDALLANALTYSFSDDEADLHLQQISTAKRVVHFTADDEHRVNFALTRIVQSNQAEDFESYKGRIALEKSFPGVHCDIGGAYNEGEEEVVGLSTEYWGIDDLEDEYYKLINYGWFTEGQLAFDRNKMKSNYLIGTRTLSNKYSFIPLHFMCELAATNKSQLPFQRPSLESFYCLKDATKKPIELLKNIKERLRKHVFGKEDNPLIFEEFAILDQRYQDLYAPSKEYDEYQMLTQEQIDLRALRNGYLHWSANHRRLGMSPRLKNKMRERQEYLNGPLKEE